MFPKYIYCLFTPATWRYLPNGSLPYVHALKTYFKLNFYGGPLVGGKKVGTHFFFFFKYGAIVFPPDLGE